MRGYAKLQCTISNDDIGSFHTVRRQSLDAYSFDGGSDDVVDFSTPVQRTQRQAIEENINSHSRHHQNRLAAATGIAHEPPRAKRPHNLRNITLRGRSHVSINDAKFSLTKSYRQRPIARDWSPARKRFVALVACFGTATIGILIGIYAGIVPAVQYYIADANHIAILGNVAMYLGMALPTFFCWPLPLLHGRRQYILLGLILTLPLLFPQAITVMTHRPSKSNAWKCALLLPRGLMGVSLGFANMNFHSTLTDLYGASLMSSNPHQELMDEDDVRRHGGGLGVWLGLWTWCFTGSLSVGFLIGAVVIDRFTPAWGFYISIILVGTTLLLSVFTPEVRHSTWRRSVAEVQTGDHVSRRVARGEVMMHRIQDGPKWWWQEAWHGVILSLQMLRQPGFTVMAVYLAWIYAQVTLIIVLLGSLTSRDYRLRAALVGASVSSVAIGALVAVPFQKANLFSRARHRPALSNAYSIDRKLTWTSHFVRRAVFTITLPATGVMYAGLSWGPPIHLIFPCLFAAMIGFLSCLAISECNGILMEVWDCSDLQTGMTGQSRSAKKAKKKTNYSSFPRVQAGSAVIHSLAFIFAAGATGIGGMAQRNLGHRITAAVVAGILLFLTLLLLGVLTRFKKVEIIPRSRTMEMNKWIEDRRHSLGRQATEVAAAKAAGRKDLRSIPVEEVGWRPLIVGNPLEKHRRVNILELGSLTRWMEIRKKNRLVDQGAHAHLNRQALSLARIELGHKSQEVLDDIHRGGIIMTDLVHKVSKRSLRSKRSEMSEISSADDNDMKRAPPREIVRTPTGINPHTSSLGTPYVERECFMGQMVPEEDEAASIDEIGNAGADLYARRRSQGLASHGMSKVRPYNGFEKQELTGGNPGSESHVVITAPEQTGIIAQNSEVEEDCHQNM
ncbi:hypothetical protein BKA67DRAFT_520098 [Truncatella angustata]|uniref:Uncharacterized protein n=1 Tax=Truncatella angustata TaxID=152316 RepID=A0A9P8ZWG9_9PEZI|nr:uncharacterized protein BKA67DRAFT_520098 [Truncatella angustata]KAH6652952.1 hypothetical protein BKA67DRAFT_520098 [Truncatella angustata]